MPSELVSAGLRSFTASWGTGNSAEYHGEATARSRNNSRRRTTAQRLRWAGTEGLAAGRRAFSGCPARILQYLQDVSSGLITLPRILDVQLVDDGNQPGRGAPGLLSLMGGGMSSVTDRNTARGLPARNGGRPVHIAYSTLPRLNRSAR